MSLFIGTCRLSVLCSSHNGLPPPPRCLAREGGELVTLIFESLLISNQFHVTGIKCLQETLKRNEYDPYVLGDPFRT